MFFCALYVFKSDSAKPHQIAEALALHERLYGETLNALLDRMPEILNQLL